MRSLLIPILCLPWLVSPSVADEFVLKDGQVIVAGFIGEADGVITILDADGERPIARSEVERIRRAPLADEALQRKTVHRRKRFRKARIKAVRKLVKSYARAKEDARASIAAELTHYAESERIPVFAEEIVSRKKPVRELALSQLEKMQRIEAVAPLVLGAVGIREADFTDRAHAAALRLSPEFTRVLYEYAAAIPMEADARVNALQRIGLMAHRDSVESLITTVYHLGLEAELQHAKKQGSRQRPMTLGNTRLTIELPVVSYFKTTATIRYSTPAVQQMQGAAIAALEKITGEKFGDDVKAWSAWWRSEKKKERKAEQARN